MDEENLLSTDCNQFFFADEKVVKNLTLPEFADEAFEKIDDATTSQDPAFYGAVQWQPEDHGTSHVSVLDGDGLAVSATTTINL